MMAIYSNLVASAESSRILFPLLNGMERFHFTFGNIFQWQEFNNQMRNSNGYVNVNGEMYEFHMEDTRIASTPNPYPLWVTFQGEHIHLD